MIINAPSSTEIVFSRTASPITVSGIGNDASLSVIIETDGPSIEFEPKLYNGAYTLPLSDLLKSLESDLSIPDTAPSGVFFFTARKATITFSEIPSLSSSPSDIKSCAIYWMPGYCRARSNINGNLQNGHYWWTTRPQSCITYKWSKEFLTIALSSGDSEPSKIHIYVDIHLGRTGKVSILYKSLLTTKQASLATIDCSYDKIESIAKENGYGDDDILAYDIYGSDGVSRDCPIGQRFIIAPNDRNVRAWTFRNSLGAFDTVYSSGELCRAIDSETRNFTTSGSEMELANISKEVFTVNTGYIRSKGELNLWYEFLRSSERYILSADGNHHRIVVDSQDSKKVLDAAGSLSFKCRMSEEVFGYAEEKSVLDEWSDEFT